MACETKDGRLFEAQGSTQQFRPGPHQYLGIESYDLRFVWKSQSVVVRGDCRLKHGFVELDSIELWTYRLRRRTYKHSKIDDYHVRFVWESLTVVGGGNLTRALKSSEPNETTKTSINVSSRIGVFFDEFFSLHQHPKSSPPQLHNRFMGNIFAFFQIRQWWN